MKNVAWCLGVLLFALSAGAQTFEPPFQLRAQRIERTDAEHLIAKGEVQVVLAGTTILADEVRIQLNADKTTEIRPTGDVVIKLANVK